jgi:uncharacterized protein (DUF305 family)
MTSQNRAPVARRGPRRRLTHLAQSVAVFVAVLVVASPATASAPAPQKATAKFEVDFMTGMVEHHVMAIEMADVCLDNAVHVELRAMCQNIIATQSEELETMQSWLQGWYGVSHEPEMKPGEMRKIEKLAGLSGADFEIRFMESMTRHHRKAIVEAKGCLDRAYHSELADLCQGIIAGQSAEIAQMQSWFCQWFGRCRGGSSSTLRGGTRRHAR